MFSFNVTKITQEMVLNGSLPAKEIADQVGKPYSTMLRELNPYDIKAKLGVETFMSILKSTGNVEPLKAMAAELGYKIVPAQQEYDYSHHDEFGGGQWSQELPAQSP